MALLPVTSLLPHSRYHLSVLLCMLCSPQSNFAGRECLTPVRSSRRPPWGRGSRRQKNSKHTSGESVKAHKPLSTSCVFHENGALVSFISCYMYKVKSRGKRRDSNYTFNRKSMFFLNIILSFKTASCFEMILKPL